MLMTAPGGLADIAFQVCFQIAKVARRLISVTKTSENSDMNVLCKKEEALLLDKHKKTVATFARK